jgi:6-phosphogluconolactonase/glucosamine-6-phosphate isomerase/deaminase
LEIKTYIDRLTTSRAAARRASQAIETAIGARGLARIVAATGASQLDFLDALTALPLDWRRVEMFHLDEYVGLTIDHPASFRRYLLERLIGKTGIERYHLLDVSRMPGKWRKTSDASFPPHPSMSPSSGSARMAIWPSTILRPISLPSVRT